MGYIFFSACQRHMYIRFVVNPKKIEPKEQQLFRNLIVVEYFKRGFTTGNRQNKHF